MLENIAFSGNTDLPPAAGFGSMVERATDLLRAQPTLPRAVATGFLVLLIGMFVLRPLTQQTQQLLNAPLPQGMLPAPAGAAVGDPAAIAAGAPLSTQVIFDRVSQQIKAEPGTNTRLIGSWIGAPEHD